MTMTEGGRDRDLGANPGSREPSPDGLGPSGFDPARMVQTLNKISLILATILVVLVAAILLNGGSQ